MQCLTRLTIFLCCAWILTLLYGEMIAYWIPLWACSWPKPPSNPSSVEDQVKVAFIADPQLMERTSLGLDPESFALGAAQFFSDIYMRRSFVMSIMPFKPDVIVFLGDQFDGGPALTDQEWQESLSRFKHIFGLNDERRKSDVSVYYLSGNHDIGYSSIHAKYPKVLSRYEKEFGPRNYHFSAGTVEFVVVDAQTLDGSTQGAETSLSWEFIKNISKVNPSKPRVLLTHIPLYHADETPCGPYRSSPIINQLSELSQQGNFKSLIGLHQACKFLSSGILVVSGHDHDQCTVTHTTPSGPVTEHTVGTVSWQQGNLYPSFMLLTATTSSNTTNSKDLISTQQCFLPMQTHIYIWYLGQFIMTLVLLVIWPTNGFGCWNWLSECMNSIRSIRRNLVVSSKEKDDEDCEYEMIWDAEGSAHLVRRPTPKGPIAKSDLGPTGRGTVTIRQTAKKTVVEEPESSVSLDINTAKVPRLNKSKARRFIGRLIRVFQLLTVIAAVNVPLYMMMLFKDWIDR
ncbi:uncharacterized protein C630.12 isoform X2 [Asparagus officinalis]|uniref:uncharacterized protein C630.12 isoform X2 n=1 Tax=Asparagus officinalis TaxID=4686 RepID=UPI00098E33A8|nr:uncharacterized protein C630.12 isoform X2 [Asparagus officinalis]